MQTTSTRRRPCSTDFLTSFQRYLRWKGIARSPLKFERDCRLKRNVLSCVPMVLIGLGSRFPLQRFSPKKLKRFLPSALNFQRTSKRLKIERTRLRSRVVTGDQFGLHPRKYGTLLTPSTCLHSNVLQFNLPRRVGDSNDRYPSTRSNHASLKRCEYRKRLLAGNSLQYVKYEEHGTNRAVGERR